LIQVQSDVAPTTALLFILASLYPTGLSSNVHLRKAFLFNDLTVRFSNRN